MYIYKLFSIVVVLFLSVFVTKLSGGGAPSKNKILKVKGLFSSDEAVFIENFTSESMSTLFLDVGKLKAELEKLNDESFAKFIKNILWALILIIAEKVDDQQTTLTSKNQPNTSAILSKRNKVDLVLLALIMNYTVKTLASKNNMSKHEYRRSVTRSNLLDKVISETDRVNKLKENNNNEETFEEENDLFHSLSLDNNPSYYPLLSSYDVVNPLKEFIENLIKILKISFDIKHEAFQDLKYDTFLSGEDVIALLGMFEIGPISKPYNKNILCARIFEACVNLNVFSMVRGSDDFEKVCFSFFGYSPEKYSLLNNDLLISNDLIGMYS